MSEPKSFYGSSGLSRIEVFRSLWLAEERKHKYSLNYEPFIRYAYALIEEGKEFDDFKTLFDEGMMPDRYHLFKCQFEFLQEALRIFREDLPNLT